MKLAELTAYAEKKYHIREQFKWADYPGFSVLAEPQSGKWAALLMRRRDPESGRIIEACDMKYSGERPQYAAPWLCAPFRMHRENWIGIRMELCNDPDTVFRLLDSAMHTVSSQGFTIVLDSSRPAENAWQDTPLPAGRRPVQNPRKAVPARIREMRRLYRYGSGGFQERCRNFYVQAKFMEDYTDDAPWDGTLKQYFTTYQELTPEQLRGYFTWRTEVRRGNWQWISTSLAYLYLYELLNGIGTASPGESLRKMKEFETCWLDSGIGDTGMRRNLHRWMLEYAVLNGLAPEQVREYVDSGMLKMDEALAVLHHPQQYTDPEVFEALCILAGGRTASSPVLQKDPGTGVHLFAEVWRRASGAYRRDGKSLFTLCFGEKRPRRWHALENAVYDRTQAPDPVDCELNESRSYRYRNGAWYEHSYLKLYFDRKLLEGLLQESDRRFRLYLKTGHPLKQKSGNAWAEPYIEEAIEADRKAVLEASRPKIHIDFTDLERIRRDAEQTRDSLLTEEEMMPVEEVPVLPEPTVPLDDFQQSILRKILKGEDVSGLIKEAHGLPEIIADGLNEALMEEIGDTVVECDGQTIVLVEDYRDDVMRILGGYTDE